MVGEIDSLLKVYELDHPGECLVILRSFILPGDAGAWLAVCCCGPDWFFKAAVTREAATQAADQARTGVVLEDPPQSP